MNAHTEFGALADLLRESSIFIDSLLADDSVVNSMSQGQIAQAESLVLRLDKVDTALREYIRAETEAASAEEPANAEPPTPERE